MISLHTLSSREKRLLLALSLFITLFLLYTFVYTPLQNISEESDELTIDQQIIKLNSIYNLYEKNRRKNISYEKLLSKKSDIAIGYIDQKLNEHDLASKIAYKRSNPTNIQNKYTRYNMDLKLVNIPIQSLLQFVHDIETSTNLIFINSLNISTVAKDRNLYDALIKIHIYEKK